MCFTPYVLLYNFRSKSHLLSQSTLLANAGSDDNDAVRETVSHYRRRRYDSELNYELS
jgi:hypothetical protein